MRDRIAEEEEARRFAAEGRKTPEIFEGVDLRAELRRFCRLPAFKGRVRGVPSMRVRWGATHWKKHVSGRAGSSRFVITINPKSTLPDVLETILHELVHISRPADTHGEMFILRLARAAREAWGIEVPRPLETDAKGYLRAYEVDVKIREALAAKFEADPASMPARVPPPPPKPPIDLAAKRAKMVEKRAEHARQMLEKNERKLKRAQKLVSKWRVTVCYYERVAAAKRG